MFAVDIKVQQTEVRGGLETSFLMCIRIYLHKNKLTSRDKDNFYEVLNADILTSIIFKKKPKYNLMITLFECQ